MIEAAIKPGHDYAFRQKRGRGVSLRRVKTIEHIGRNKWRAEWIEPNPGRLRQSWEAGQRTYASAHCRAWGRAARARTWWSSDKRRCCGGSRNGSRATSCVRASASWHPPKAGVTSPRRIRWPNHRAAGPYSLIGEAHLRTELNAQ